LNDEQIVKSMPSDLKISAQHAQDVRSKRRALSLNQNPDVIPPKNQKIQKNPKFSPLLSKKFSPFRKFSFFIPSFCSNPDAGARFSPLFSTLLVPLIPEMIRWPTNNQLKPANEIRTTARSTTTGSRTTDPAPPPKKWPPRK
jgi:hypothetical protein